MDEAYKAEEDFWKKKCRINWLKKGDRNTKFFHATIAERRKRNRLDRIRNEAGGNVKENKKLQEKLLITLRNFSPQISQRNMMKSLLEFLGQFLSQ